MLIRAASGSGIKKTLRRPSLALLLYAVSLVIAGLLAVPVYRAIETLVGPSGFSPELAAGFDVVLWADWLEKGGTALAASARQVVLAIPLYVVWKTASHVGLIHALSGDGDRGFWEGVGRHTLKALPIALAYLVLAVLILGGLWTILIVLIGGMGDAAAFWTTLVVAPLLTVMAIARLDVMHDYARIHLVLRGGVWRSLIEGSFWPLRHFSALMLYDVWFLVGAVFWILPFALDFSMPKVTVIGMMTAFLLQQIAIFIRYAVMVGWVGSEVFYFEQRAEPEPGSDLDVEEPGSGEDELGVT